jgi:hypothetical protein
MSGCGQSISGWLDGPGLITRPCISCRVAYLVPIFTRCTKHLSMPVWLCHGTRGDFTDDGQTRLLAQRENWSITVFDSGALPYFEVAREFGQDYDEFLRTHR